MPSTQRLLLLVALASASTSTLAQMSFPYTPNPPPAPTFPYCTCSDKSWSNSPFTLRATSPPVDWFGQTELSFVLEPIPGWESNGSPCAEALASSGVAKLHIATSMSCIGRGPVAVYIEDELCSSCRGEEAPNLEGYAQIKVKFRNPILIGETVSIRLVGSGSCADISELLDTNAIGGGLIRFRYAVFSTRELQPRECCPRTLGSIFVQSGELPPDGGTWPSPPGDLIVPPSAPPPPPEGIAAPPPTGNEPPDVPTSLVLPPPAIGAELPPILLLQPPPAPPSLPGPAPPSPPDAPPAFGLFITPSQITAGDSVRLIFTATFATDPGTARVRLYELFGSSGDRSNQTFLLDMRDDGSFSSRDAVAGDGIYSATIAVRKDQPGTTIIYAAEVDQDPQSVVFASVDVVDTVTDADFDNGEEIAREAQAGFDMLRASGTPLAEALEAVAEALREIPEVDASSIKMGASSVMWDMKGSGLGYYVYGRQDPADGGGVVRRRRLLLATQQQPAALHGDVQLQQVVKGGSSAGEAASTKPNRKLAAGDGRVLQAVTPGGDSTCDPKGNVLVLSPFLGVSNEANFTAEFDESEEVADLLKADKYEITFKCGPGASGCPGPTVSLGDFKDWGSYAAVVYVGHGDSDDSGANQILLSGVRYNSMAMRRDHRAGRLRAGYGVYGVALTAAWFGEYTNQCDGTIIYLGACRTMRGNSFVSVFGNLGAGAVAGYTDIVLSGFAATHGIAMFKHLTEDEGTVGDIPGIGDVDTFDKDNKTFTAEFRVVITSDVDNVLPVQCNLLNRTDLHIEYTWPLSQEDLDTGTGFLGGTVGFFCGGTTPYLDWSGDDTSAGGKEVVVVDLFQAHVGRKWSKQVLVYAAAGWYAPAKGSGPATMTISYRDKATRQLRSSQQVSIDPGSQRGCASTLVGTVNVTTRGGAGKEVVRFRLQLEA